MFSSVLVCELGVLLCYLLLHFPCPSVTPRPLLCSYAPLCCVVKPVPLFLRYAPICPIRLYVLRIVDKLDYNVTSEASEASERRSP